MQSFSTQLTASQASFLQSLLPRHYSLQPLLSESKRKRPVKKLDESFTADFALDTRRIVSKPASQSLNYAIEGHEISAVAPKSSKKASIRSEQSPEGQGSISKGDLRSSLLRLLEKLKNCRFAWPFRLPVDPVAQGVPNYAEIVKEPMDLSTIERNLKEGSYHQTEQFHADVSKIISNSYTFNPQQSKFYAITQKFEAFYLKLCEESASCAQLHHKKSEKNGYLSPLCNKKGGKAEQATKTELTMAERLTCKERQALFHQIYELPQCDIIKLISIVDEGNLPRDWKEFELDFKDIDDEKFKKIVKLVNDKAKTRA